MNSANNPTVTNGHNSSAMARLINQVERNYNANALQPTVINELLMTPASLAYENEEESAEEPEFEIKSIDDYSITEDEDMKFIVIPEGTLLYNAVRIPEIPPEDDYDYEEKMYERTMKEWMGTYPMKHNIRVEGNQMFVDLCVDKSAQKFFYSNPAGCPALKNVTQGHFNHVNVFQTTHEMRLAILMSPSDHHRSTGPYHPDKIQCNHLPVDVCACTVQESNYNIQICPHLHHYDTCLTPEFLNRQQADGHIAIAKGDSYTDRMRRFDNYIDYYFDVLGEAPAGDPLTNSFIKTTNRALFDVGRSVDIREPIPPDFPNLSVLTGFPELVLHLYGTQWFNEADSINAICTIDLPDGHDLTDRLYALAEYTMADNESGEVSLPLNEHTQIISPMKLIGHSNPAMWLNFESKNRLYLPQRILMEADELDDLDHMYINLLNAFAHGDHQFYFDTRTGFLINDHGDQNNVQNRTQLITREGTGITFKNSCTYYGLDGQSDFIKSAQSRKSPVNEFWRRDHDRLIDLFDPRPPYEVQPANINLLQRGGFVRNNKMTRRNIRRNNISSKKNTKTIRRNNKITLRNNKTNKANNKKLNIRNNKTQRINRNLKKMQMQRKNLKTKTILTRFTPKPLSDEKRRAIEAVLAMPYERPQGPHSVTKKALALTDALMMD